MVVSTLLWIAFIVNNQDKRYFGYFLCIIIIVVVVMNIIIYPRCKNLKMRLTDLTINWTGPGRWLVGSRVNRSDVTLLLGRCKISKKKTPQSEGIRKWASTSLSGNYSDFCSCADGLAKWIHRKRHDSRSRRNRWDIFLSRSMKHVSFKHGLISTFRRRVVARRLKNCSNQSELGFLYEPGSWLVLIGVGVSVYHFVSGEKSVYE